MLLHIVPITALLAGVALLLLGTGLTGTLLAVRGSLEGFSDHYLGLLGSAYFVGFLIGGVVSQPLLRRIGHIRAFTFFAASVAATLLLHGLLVAPAAWMVLRALTGVSLVALYTIIESWLSSHAPREHRGRIFAVYMAVNLGALALAQQLLRLDDPAQFTLFAVAALFVCLAVLPVAATRLAPPVLSAASRLGPAALWRSAPVAVAGAALSGLAMGAFWGMGPVFAARIGLGGDGIALFMSAAILGGAAFQLPLGAFSDHRDRRFALAAVTGLAALVAVLLVPATVAGTWAIVGGAFLYGGLAFAVYPIAVAHLNDHLSTDDILSGSTGLLLIHGVGAAIGPALAGLLMGLTGPQALPAFFAAMQFLLAAWAFRTYRRIADEAVGEPAHFVPMLRTSSAALEMMPAPGDAPDAHFPPADVEGQGA
jgi:MFS family permease